MGDVTRFPLHKARALPVGCPRQPAEAKAAASDSSKESGAGSRDVSRAAPPSLRSSSLAPSPPDAAAQHSTADGTRLRPSFRQVAENCIDLARFAINGEFVEDISVLCKKCGEDLLYATASEAHDGAMRDALWMLLTNIKHFCEADSRRRPVWARAIAVNKATVRDLYHLEVPS